MDEKLLELLKLWVEELVDDKVGECDNRHIDWDGGTGAHPEKVWQEVVKHNKLFNN